MSVPSITPEVFDYQTELLASEVALDVLALFRKRS